MKITPEQKAFYYPEIVRECAAELRSRNIEINNMDALQVMSRYDTPDTLHYVDPPYVQSSRSSRMRYAHEYDQEDHERLLVFLKTLKGKIVLLAMIPTFIPGIFPAGGRSARFLTTRKAARRLNACGLTTTPN